MRAAACAALHQALLALRHGLGSAEAADHPGSDGGDVAVVALFLPTLRKAPLPLGQARGVGILERAHCYNFGCRPIAGSFNGRTADSGSAYRGSSPCPATTSFMDWNAPRINSLIERALIEDHVLGDTTTQYTVDARQVSQAEIIAKQACVLSGLGAIPRVFDIYTSLRLKAGRSEPLPPVVVTSRAEIFDGVRLQPGQTIAVLRGPAWPLLSCERVTLNLLQRLSGIATLTRQFVEAVKDLPVRILDTRKTAPGMRVLDKYAVTCGGGHNHRSDLSDAILIKNNHIRLAGGLATALQRARDRRRPGQSIEVEVRSAAELDAALAGGAERVLLDNMTPEQVTAAVATVAGRAQIEVSGGVRLATVRAYAAAKPNFISVGALTHSAPAVDLSMRIIPVGVAAVS